MVTVSVAAGQSILEGFVKTPVKGLAELIWNAFDADSTHVELRVVRNTLGGASRIEIEDNGAGMSRERAEIAFSRVGDSWKRPGGKTDGKRPLHGRHGRGRYAAFSLGGLVEWVSVSEAVNGGELEGVTVLGAVTDLSTFEVRELSRQDESQGVLVQIDRLTPEAVRVLDDSEDLKNALLAEFALHLDRHSDFVIEVLGEVLKPADAMIEKVELPVKMPEDAKGSATLTVIQWDLDRVRRVIYLSDADGSVIDEAEARVHAPGLEFTAYLTWPGFAETGPLSLQDDGDTVVGRVLDAARDALRDYVAEASREAEAKKIKQWQAEGVYPFKAEPKDPLERATRAAFNVVAMAASRTVDDTKSTKTKALSLSLLKQTLENDPESLLPILEEVARLPKARIEELSNLLEHTTFSQLIQVGNAIGNRVEFLDGLRSILFDRQIKKRMLERRQLHRILAHETWIFGEEWAITGDDERLTVVLARFLKKLGKEGEVELGTLQPVRRTDGSDAIPDLVLGRQLVADADRLENLVVELKRPSHRLQDEDLVQLRSYATAIVGNEMFDQPNVTWEFWLVGNEVSPEVDSQRNSPTLPYGCIQVNSKFKIYVKTWAEIISDCSHRLKFVQRSLQYETENDQGLDYLRENYARYLPDVALEADGGGVSESRGEASGQAGEEEEAAG